MRNVVLLHGAWHGAWCWTPITARLAARGVPAVAVDMAGHGLHARSPEVRWAQPFDPAAFATASSPVATVTVGAAADDLIDQLRLIGGGEPCVVVAHSMGGIVATAAAERAPELFAHLMYVSAFTPVSGHPTADYLGFPESAGEMVAGQLAANPAAIGALRLGTAVRHGHARLRETFYNGVDEATADAAIALLSPDFPAAVVGETFPVSAGRYGSVEHSYVVCTRDNAVRPALQRRLIREIDAVSHTAVKVFELDSGHSPFLSHPDALTELIASAANTGSAGRGKPVPA